MRQMGTGWPSGVDTALMIQSYIVGPQFRHLVLILVTSFSKKIDPYIILIWITRVTPFASSVSPMLIDLIFNSL